MTHSLQRFAFFSFLFCASAVAANAQPDRVRGAIDNSQTSVLHGMVHPKAQPANDQGAVEDSLTLPGINMLLKPSAAQQSALEQLLAQQQDPASSNYHKWLTPEQYADRFGLSANDMGKITAWVKSQGFTVTGTARGRNFVTFSGTAQQVKAAFHTEIHRYYSVNGESHYANATDPSIPTALAGVVASIRGLNDFRLTPRLRKPSLPLATSGNMHQIAPDDFATIYDVTPLFQAGVDGTGQKLVVVGQTDINLSDIQNFRSKFNLSAPNLQQMLVPGSPDPGISSGDLPEADLDIEWSGAVARNATVIYVYSDDVWDSAAYAVDQDLAPVLTMSYGTCEPGDLGDIPTYQTIAQQANAEGITWFAAAGDSGAADCEDPGASIAQNGLAVDLPGSVPEITSMGGTEFAEQSGGPFWSSTNTANGASALGYIPEIGWNDTAIAGELRTTGGGGSVFFPQPAWQAGPGVPGDGVRHVPDLALSASANHDGYYVYTGGALAIYGGTSVAAPTMAGIFTLMNHYLTSTGIQSQPGLANVNPTLYRMAQSTPNAFHDVTAGNNIVPCAVGSPNCTTGTIGYNAAAGYDSVTGLGSVDAANLIHQWSSAAPSGSSVVASINQNPVFEQQPNANGDSWVFQLTLSEQAGVSTTLTGLSIAGVNYASQIAALFGSAKLAAHGSVSVSIGIKNLTVPMNVLFTYAGVDASGRQWSGQISVPFQGFLTQLQVGGISNAATGQQAYAPGMILSIYGAALGAFVQSTATIPLPQYLAGFEATINGVVAPLYYVSPSQVNVQIPYETNPGPATLIVGNPYTNVTYNFTVSAAAPGIFTFQNGSINPFPSAAAGQTVTLYVTGEGQVTPSLATGSTPSPKTQTGGLPKPRLPVSVTVGGVAATIQFIGIPSGLVGVTQINYIVPSGVSGVQPVVVTVGGVASPAATLTVTQ
jgi:uncharacterized protein (TIGR03437 family)